MTSLHQYLLVDTLVGGSGNDTYVINNAGDTITAGTGTGTVQSSVSYTLSAGLNNLTLTGTATYGLGNGNSLGNVITAGNSLNDTLDGTAGGPATLVGGTGNDTYIIANSDETVTKGSGTGYGPIKCRLYVGRRC